MKEIVWPEVLYVAHVCLGIPEVEKSQPAIVHILVCAAPNILGPKDLVKRLSQHSIHPGHLDVLSRNHLIFSNTL